MGLGLTKMGSVRNLAWKVYYKVAPHMPTATPASPVDRVLNKVLGTNNVLDRLDMLKFNQFLRDFKLPAYSFPVTPLSFRPGVRLGVNVTSNEYFLPVRPVANYVRPLLHFPSCDGGAKLDFLSVVDQGPIKMSWDLDVFNQRPRVAETYARLIWNKSIWNRSALGAGLNLGPNPIKPGDQ